MKLEFLQYLPLKIDSDKHVLIIANDDTHDVKQLPTIIEEMNGDDNWARLIVKSSVPDTAVNLDCAIIFIMVGVGNGTMMVMKVRARNLGILCVSHTLTKNQLREALKLLKERRVVKPNGHANGSAVSLNGSKPPIDRRNLGTEKVINPSESSLAQEPAEPRIELPEQSSISDEAQREAFAALEAVEAWKTAAEAARIAAEKATDALGRVVSRYTDVTKELAVTREQMESKDRNYKLVEDRNIQLQAENTRLQGIENELRPILEKFSPSRR
jgi:hypothetical protein